jgi:hypothetical protein
VGTKKWQGRGERPTTKTKTLQSSTNQANINKDGEDEKEMGDERGKGLDKDFVLVKDLLESRQVL